MQSEISNYKETYANLKVLEKYNRIDLDNVHGIGVQGKRFKLVKKEDSFFARIWFSIKKLFHIIKVDKESIATLIDRVKLILNDPNYKDWAMREGKITKQRRIVLIDNNKKLRDTVADLEQKQTRLQQALDGRTALYDKETRNHKENLKKAIKQVTSLEKELKEKNEVLENSKDLSEQKLAEYMAAWIHVSPEKSVVDVLEEYSSKKSTVETIKDTVRNVNKHVSDKIDKHKKDKQPSVPTLPTGEKEKTGKKKKSTDNKE